MCDVFLKSPYLILSGQQQSLQLSLTLAVGCSPALTCFFGVSPFDAIETPHRRFVLISRWLFPALFAGHLFFAPSTKFHITIYLLQIRGRKPKKQPIRAGGISASPPQATRGCAARCRGFAAFACACETQQYRQLRRLGFSLLTLVIQPNTVVDLCGMSAHYDFQPMLLS